MYDKELLMSGKIIRAPKKRDFARINNSVFRDKRLSWAAKGMLGYLLSRPDNWQVNTWDLVEYGPSGLDAVRASLRELTRLGYLRRVRTRNADGTYGWFTIVYEDPRMAEDAELDVDTDVDIDDLAS
jgi:hypothetical protein